MLELSGKLVRSQPWIEGVVREQCHGITEPLHQMGIVGDPLPVGALESRVPDQLDHSPRSLSRSSSPPFFTFFAFRLRTACFARVARASRAASAYALRMIPAAISFSSHGRESNC